MRIAFCLGLMVTCCGGKVLNYSPAPADNPLKGFVPYAIEWKKERFPHSMEFSYLALNEVMKGWGKYDWSALEKTLEKGKAGGRQTIFRFYLEYPGKKLALPDFLLAEGVKIVEWKDDEGQACLTPDYEDVLLRRAISEFIAALGKKYDGDPRVGFITMGMLGKWGEWHNFPRGDLWASHEVQKEVMAAFENAFSKTHILLRYPAGERNYHYADNRGVRVGYHDDSFAWATLETGKKGEEWFFVPSMKQAGLTEKWKYFPIGGEVRPELWETTFTDQKHPKGQKFMQCVEETHVSWLMDSGLFQNGIPLDDQRKARALKAVQRMGYEFFLREITLDEQVLHLTIENRGVAPFYYDWPIELGFSAPKVRTQSIFVPEKLSTILPGEAMSWGVKLPTKPTQIRLRIPNPMEGGKALRFANQECKGDYLQVDF